MIYFYYLKYKSILVHPFENALFKLYCRASISHVTAEIKDEKDKSKFAILIKTCKIAFIIINNKKMFLKK